MQMHLTWKGKSNCRLCLISGCLFSWQEVETRCGEALCRLFPQDEHIDVVEILRDARRRRREMATRRNREPLRLGLQPYGLKNTDSGLSKGLLLLGRGVMWPPAMDYTASQWSSHGLGLPQSGSRGSHGLQTWAKDCVVGVSCS